MGNYTIQYKKSVDKELRKLSQLDRVLVVKKIKSLEQDPFPAGVTKLQGQANLFRVRQGDYRIIFQVKGKKLIILIVKIGHRREVYREH